ncbi:MAG: MFS transporter [Phycisphaeraceae bacterium]
MTYLQLFVVLCLPITGLCYATLGAIKLSLSQRLKLDEAKVGGLISAFGFMVGPVILLCGALSDAYGRKPVWMVGSALVGISFLIFAKARRYGLAVLATILLAAGWTAMINVANPVMGNTFPGNQFASMNFGDAMFGAGAFLCPILVAVLRRKLGFEKGIGLIAVLAFIPLILAAVPQSVSGLDMGGGELKGDLAAAFAGFRELANDKTIWLLGLTLMCWVVIESGTAGWASTLVKESAPQDEPVERSERIAAAALSAFWLCFMGSRLVAALLLHAVEDQSHLVATTQVLQLIIAVLAVLTMLGLVVSRSRKLVVPLVVFAGLLCGPFFPNLIAQLFTHLGARGEMGYAGRAIGMLFACASVGWTLLPTAMGFVARRKGIRRAFLLPAAVGVVMAVLILINKITV